MEGKRVTTGLYITGLYITGLSITGLYITGLYITGLYITGLYITGLYITGLYIAGLYSTGLYITGLYITGLYITGLYITGLYIAGLYSTGLYITGLYITGLYITGLYIAGLYSTGLYITGLYITGLYITGLYITGLYIIGLYRGMLPINLLPGHHKNDNGLSLMKRYETNFNIILKSTICLFVIHDVITIVWSSYTKRRAKAIILFFYFCWNNSRTLEVGCLATSRTMLFLSFFSLVFIKSLVLHLKESCTFTRITISCRKWILPENQLSTRY